MDESSPRLLVMDTSGRGGVVAVCRGDTVLARLFLEETRRQARDLVPATARLLKDQGWTARDLDAVLVGLGPGSYTGLRVGLIAAKTLAYATGCSILGVETFAAIASQMPAEVESVDVIADAQQERVYLQPFKRSDTEMKSAGPMRISGVSEWLDRRDPLAHVSGPGVEVHRPRLQGIPLIEAPLCRPTVEGLLRVGLPRYRDGQTDDVWKLEPIYLRPSAAEEQWERLGRGSISGPVGT